MLPWLTSTNSSVSITRTSQGAVSNHHHWNTKAEHCQETQLEIIQLLMPFSDAQSSFFRKDGDYYEKIALSSWSLQTSSLPFHLAFGLPCAEPGKCCLIAESLQSRKQKIAVYLISTPHTYWYWVILILKMLNKVTLSILWLYLHILAPYNRRYETACDVNIHSKFYSHTHS